MKVYIPLLLSASSFLTTTIARTFTVANNCSYNIWSLLTDSTNAPDYPTGWLAPPSSNVSFTVPGDWKGQIWGRRDCNFTTNPGADSCLDGGCPGGLLCTGQGQSPVTIAEFILTTDTNLLDDYGISLVNGFNVPMRINNSANCGVVDCSVDLGANCPIQLQESYQPTGFPTGCNSACAAGLASDPNNDPNCCTGKYNSAETCVASGVQYSSYFKKNCPDTYVYAFDKVESEVDGGRPLHSCSAANNADYIITFCSEKN
ncbi:Osmotin thaumatin-like protein [Lactarius quietus]|nr:Osmotin thaumatin-like protein [Lactarius quietus]